MEDKLKCFIMAGSRDNCDSADMEEMYQWVTEAISNHQTSYKNAAVAVALCQKYKFYERDGMKSARSYLLSLGYSKGTISHLLKYGAFIIKMQFEPHQIPPESVVRAILIDKNEDLWHEHYTAACKKHFATKSAQGKTCVKGGSAASRAAGAHNAEADVSTASECGGDDEEGGENSAVMVDGANPPERDDDSEEDEAESPRVDYEGQQPHNPIFDNIPTKAEIRDVLKEYRRKDPDNIYLPSIGESMPRQDTFTSGALEKLKDKFTSVAILCLVVKEFKSAGGQLSDADIESINNFCADIHSRENERLEKAINGESDADEGGSSAEDAADDDGDEK